ncbi:hypothetical protein JKP88DRAFT_275391 [Tribonema minus]|uniref:Uncharacterized protein n=1 Tax=Tribonema minus TaxID=303371 RepID=A0A835Z9H9_9STRA|nr:hypothetical protein JKP88DRAFT_275391 [Tribonema minus]
MAISEDHIVGAGQKAAHFHDRVHAMWCEMFHFDPAAIDKPARAPSALNTKSGTTEEDIITQAKQLYLAGQTPKPPKVPRPYKELEKQADALDASGSEDEAAAAAAGGDSAKEISTGTAIEFHLPQKQVRPEGRKGAKVAAANLSRSKQQQRAINAAAGTTRQEAIDFEYNGTAKRKADSLEKIAATMVNSKRQQKLAEENRTAAQLCMADPTDPHAQAWKAAFLSAATARQQLSEQQDKAAAATLAASVAAAARPAAAAAPPAAVAAAGLGAPYDDMYDPRPFSPSPFAEHRGIASATPRLLPEQGRARAIAAARSPESVQQIGAHRVLPAEARAMAVARSPPDSAAPPSAARRVSVGAHRKLQGRAPKEPAAEPLSVGVTFMRGSA